MSTQSELLREIAEIVGGERSKDYGPPKINLDRRTASLWNTYMDMRSPWDRPIDGVDVCNMMILVKMARIMENGTIKDNYADIAGYAAAAWEIVEEQRFDDPIF
jgi:hypothetical protein